MSSLLTIIHVIVCVFLVLTILLQSGKSGGMGAAFGGGNAATVFGGSGASSFLRKLTASAATCFMVTSMVLAFLASHNSADSLEKFGESQQKLADEKEKAKEKALEDAKKGSNAGSGSAGSGSAAGIVTPPMAGSSDTMMTPSTTKPDLEAPAAGSATPAKTDAPKTDAPKADAPKTDAPKTDAPKTDAPKTDAPKTDAPKTGSAAVPAATPAPAK